MAQIKLGTIMMAIQALEAQMNTITHSRKFNNLNADDQELLLSYSMAAIDLEKAYRKEQKKTSNFPPYEKLISRKKLHKFS